MARLTAALEVAQSNIGDLRARMAKKEGLGFPKQVKRAFMRAVSAKVAPYAGAGKTVDGVVTKLVAKGLTEGGTPFDPNDPKGKYDVDESEHLMRHTQAAYLLPDGPGTAGDAVPGWMKDAETNKTSLTAALANGLGAPNRKLKLLAFHDHKKTDTQAYVAASVDRPGELYFVCRGTTTITDWLTDFSISKTLYEPENDDFDDFRSCAGCCGQVSWSIDHGRKPLVHVGFYRSFLTMRDLIAQWAKHELPDGLGPLKKVFVCGHSLGGALACVVLPYVLQLLNPKKLASSGVEVTLFTVGAPRVGTSGYLKMLAKLTAPLEAKGLYKSRRMVNDVDIVPRIPPAFMGFRHVGDLYIFLESEREGERPTLMVGGTMTQASDSSVLKYVSHGAECVSDHMVPVYRSMNAAQAPDAASRLAPAGPP